jgi:isoaspartyl peptidase/L-asparaginase-like protein (Ntn-hydrolase superfamily)
MAKRASGPARSKRAWPTDVRGGQWLKKAGRGVVDVLRSMPYAGAGLISGGALALAMWTGAGELVVAGVTGYVAYRVLKDKTSVAEGIEEGIRLAKGDPSPGARRGRAASHS